MIKVILAGKYPINTFEKLETHLPKDQFQLERVETQDAYDSLTDAEILILRGFKAPEEFINRNPKLKMIMRWGTGVDSVDIQAACKQNVIVTNTPGANAEAVAELAVMMMLSLCRRLLPYTESVRKGEWNSTSFLNESFCLYGKMVGIIGGGNIGRKVAKMVQAFGGDVQYYDLFRLPQEKEQEANIKFREMKDLLQTSDIISLHLPLTSDTRGLIGRNELALMKQNAFLINTSRGGLVNDNALSEAILNKKIAGAGLDVVEDEEHIGMSKLLTLPNVIVTPHIGGSTADIGDSIIPMLVQDILEFAEGKEPKHIVNKDRLFLGDNNCGKTIVV